MVTSAPPSIQGQPTYHPETQCFTWNELGRSRLRASSSAACCLVVHCRAGLTRARPGLRRPAGHQAQQPSQFSIVASAGSLSPLGANASECTSQRNTMQTGIPPVARYFSGSSTPLAPGTRHNGRAGSVWLHVKHPGVTDFRHPVGPDDRASPPQAPARKGPPRSIAGCNTLQNQMSRATRDSSIKTNTLRAFGYGLRNETPLETRARFT